MPTKHILECPNCHWELLISAETAVGGVVQDHLIIVDSRSPEEAAKAAKGGSE